MEETVQETFEATTHGGREKDEDKETSEKGMLRTIKRIIVKSNTIKNNHSLHITGSPS